MEKRYFIEFLPNLIINIRIFGVRGASFGNFWGYFCEFGNFEVMFTFFCNFEFTLTFFCNFEVMFANLDNFEVKFEIFGDFWRLCLLKLAI